ncbi:MAG TPA: EAL domain-containing protein [Nevskiaceae bacterium]|nr:EAL domain-containing protein [Nevskiaceae bacterium]
MSVRTRLRIFVFGLFALLGLMAFELYRFVSAEQKLIAAENVQAQRLEVLQELQSAFTQYRYWNWYLLSSAMIEDERETGRRSAELALERVTLALERATPLDPEPMAQLMALTRRYQSAIAEAELRLQAGDPAGYRQQIIDGRALVAELQQRLDQAQAREQGTQTALRNAQRLRAEHALGQTALIGGSILVGGLLLLWLILRQVVRPLDGIGTALRQLHDPAQGSLPGNAGAVDEFGEMVTALRQFRAQSATLHYLAYTDSLTDLPNRARLERALTERLSDHRISGRSLALMFLDLDHFKSINDSLGHSRGDRYLREAAYRLRQLAPPQSLIVRYSGDEFAILLTDLAADGGEQGRVEQLAQRILEGMSLPVDLEGHSLSMSASIGIALFPRDVADVDELVSSADAAMYLAKRYGRNRVQFATPTLTADIRNRVRLASDIRRGLAADEFEPFYQPVLDVMKGTVIGAEALLRWRHPERGLVMPGEFVLAAEESGSIDQLGGRCLERGCADLQRLAEQHPQIRVCVNLSVRELRSNDLVTRVRRTLQRAGLKPGQLELEITESTAMEHAEATTRVLHELHQLGVNLSIDDFGTGYSSLAYVQRLPVQKIKIDRTFVAQLCETPEAEAIVVATLAMARALKLDVVAEGVETIAQMLRLCELGCTQQQGFLFSRALPAEDFRTWVATAPKRVVDIASVA